jgi:7-carboxy-7-deazaguanine synthase
VNARTEERAHGSAPEAEPARRQKQKRYGIKEVFATLQGEGAQAGTPAVFLRFSGCNLGYNVCPWCDTDWTKPEYLLDLSDTIELVQRVAREGFGREPSDLLVVVTGGEPSLQLDRPLSEALRRSGFRIAMESNGSREVDRSLVDWLTVSPKQPSFVQREGDELKLLFTGTGTPGITPDTGAVQRMAAGTRFRYFWLQPIDLPERGGPNFDETVRAVMELGNPWRLSVQTHKIAGIR